MTKNQAFKVFGELFPNLKEVDKTDFSRVANKLLQDNFLTKRKTQDANDYRFILAYKELFESFFALVDFELVIKREFEVVFIKNLSLYNHLRLRKVESVLILVIRILYQHKMEYVTLDENVEVVLSEIHDELTRIGYLDNKRITKNELKPALSMLKNYNIIDYIDQGLHDDARLKIYPTILFVTDFESIKEVVTRLDEYTQGVGNNEEISED